MRWFAPVLLLAACGDSATAPVDGTPDGPAPDATPIDAFVPDAWPCAPDTSVAECDNCIDDDADGLVDGWDPECAGAYDIDEGAFEFGYPDKCEGAWGSRQDCYFDGNSGAGDDGCVLHVCCSLVDCPAELAVDFDPSQCTLADACRDYCQPLVTPDCDCMGCCTICEGESCRDAYVDACLLPDCDDTNLAACPSCTKRTDCGPLEGGATCVTSEDCGATGWCARGVCIEVPP